MRWLRLIARVLIGVAGAAAVVAGAMIEFHEGPALLAWALVALGAGVAAGAAWGAEGVLSLFMGGAIGGPGPR